jgi:hypothetical protein
LFHLQEIFGNCPRILGHVKRSVAIAACLLTVAGAPLQAQSRRAPTRPLIRTQPAEMTCPQPLGRGLRTGRSFCDVPAGNDAAKGVIVKVPKHQGVATLTFDLHNRQTYSAQEERSGKAYASYTATIGVLTLDNTLLHRFVVQSEFRRESDLFDRVVEPGASGAVKAIAPTGVEPVVIDIPAGVDAVSILGEKLVVVRSDGQAVYTMAGRPIAIISQAMIEYRPAATKKKGKR